MPPKFGVPREEIDEGMHELVERNSIRELVKLAQEGADMSVLDKNGRTVLGHAVFLRNYPMIRALLKAQVDPN